MDLHVSIYRRFFNSSVYLLIHIWWSSYVVVRSALRDDGMTPLRFLDLTKGARYRKASDDFFGRKDLNYQPVTSIFY